ncbi:heme-binding-like protein At3g10130, chloroplastic [Nymphaea colorata]|uniref:heme-binding-like protein At3g10130, chloroplastic n=1 Tax=Nymphaea colorata TaxID=210225 RepID=UPI00129D999E|nr:heme-binding-like protein At3g10130, chloroplastic [Nymphaea colorata]
MGLVLGKITVETPKYQVVNKTAHYEIRKYEPSIIAEVTYDPKDMKGDPDGGFMILANYIGALGNPQNTKPEKIAMTAPVITQESAEKIAMTAPVITQEAKPQPESIAMTAPVVTKSDEGKKLVTMQFVLPGSKYSKLEDVPRPTDPRVVIKQVEDRKYAVVTFSGVANDKVVQEKLLKLKAKLEEDGCKIVGEHLLARYNPPWTLPPLRTNEIFVPVE